MDRVERVSASGNSQFHEGVSANIKCPEQLRTLNGNGNGNVYSTLSAPARKLDTENANYYCYRNENVPFKNGENPIEI